MSDSATAFLALVLDLLYLRRMELAVEPCFYTTWMIMMMLDPPSGTAEKTKYGRNRS